MQLQIRKTGFQFRPLALRFLHAVFAEYSMTGL